VESAGHCDLLDGDGGGGEGRCSNEAVALVHPVLSRVGCAGLRDVCVADSC
jgi:hypothetical protein